MIIEADWCNRRFKVKCVLSMLDFVYLLDKIVSPMSGFFLGALFTYWMWRQQRKEEKVDARFRELTIFSATNNDLTFDLEYYLSMKGVSEGLKRMVEANQGGSEVEMQHFPAKYNKFSCIDKSIFGLINDTKSLNIASFLYNEGDKIKHRFDSIHEKIDPDLQRLILENKGRSSQEYRTLVDSRTREYFDKVCESFLEFSVRRYYLFCRFETIKNLGYHKKDIKRGSSIEAEIDHKSEELMEKCLEGALEKALKSFPEIVEVKESMFSYWENFKEELKRFDRPNESKSV